jgi:hypothetical protein
MPAGRHTTTPLITELAGLLNTLGGIGDEDDCITIYVQRESEAIPLELLVSVKLI